MLKIVILSRIIALIAGGKYTEFKIPTRADIAESCHVVAVKCVSVPNVAVNIESANCGTKEFLNVRRRFSGRHIQVVTVTRSKIEDTLLLGTGRKHEVWNYVPIWEFFYGSNTASISGSLSSVCEFKFQRHPTVSSEPFGASWQNISTQLFLSGCFGGGNLPNQTDELQNSDERQNAGEFHQPPVGRRLVIAVIGYLGGFLLTLRGFRSCSRGHNPSGHCLIGAGILSATVGVALWFALGFSASWHWLI